MAWRTSLALAAGVLAGVAGCGAEGTSEMTDADQEAGAEGPCAWATQGGREINNIAYPDAAATYWAVSYNLAPEESLELRGSFPAARYASFTTYGPHGGAVDALTDRDIEPDDGSSNPFRGEALRDPDQQRYTVVIRPERPSGDAGSGEERSNVIAAQPEPGTDAATRRAPSTTLGPDGSAAPDPALDNLLGTGDGNGTAGTVIYRVYVPDDEGDPAGGAGLPQVTLVGRDGARLEVPTCSAPGASPRALELAQTYGPPTDRTAPPQPVFVRPEAGAANLYPNPDNVYIATIVEHQPGRVVVIRGKAPTFPDPAQGRLVGSGEQLRYWSLCTNEYRRPFPVSFCLIDRDVVLDDQDNYTVVVSTPEDRPANATAENGVTWLEWGSTEFDNLLLLRHMLPDPNFSESATNLDPGTLASSSMGPYAPAGTYCQRADFEQHGPRCEPEPLSEHAGSG